MSDWLASMAFESAFEPPRDCRIRGDVSCRVVESRCEIIDKWCDRVTIKVTLRLRLTIRRGGLLCRFERRVVIKETVWCDPHALIVGCRVTAAVCRCRIRKGVIICVGAVQVRILIRRPEPCFPCPCTPPCPTRCHRPGWSSDWPSDCSTDYSSDWSPDSSGHCVTDWPIEDGCDSSGSDEDCVSGSTSGSVSGCLKGPPPDRPYLFTPTRSRRRKSRRC
jgi:hypothetical protein